MSKRSFPNRGRKSGKTSGDSRDNNTGKPASNRRSGRNNPPGDRKSGPFSKKRDSRESDKRASDRGEKRSNFTRVNKSKGDERPFGAPKRASRSEGDRQERPRKFGKPANRSFGDGRERRDDSKRSDNSGFSKRRTSSGSDKPYARPSTGKAEGRTPRKSVEPYQAETPVQTEKIRLNRYIANSGVCSRREADELIKMGLVSVNGKTITEMGYKVNPGDEVRYENKVLRAEKPVYVLLNKPKGYLTTTSDPQERNTVMHLIGDKIRERIYPVGRLDRNTTGLLLLTNDGDLADKLMHPSYNVKKIYKVELDRPLTKVDFQKILEGVQLEEGRAMVDDLAIVSDDGKTVGVELHIGWNRVVRRIFEALEYEVVRLDRSVYAGLDKKDLPRGHWRFLRKEEVVRLKHFK